jgi:hypothetical protein
LQGLVVFSIDGDMQTLDLRGGKGKTYKGMPENGEKPELTLTISDDNFGKLVMGKLGPQQVLFHYRMTKFDPRRPLLIAADLCKVMCTLFSALGEHLM